MFESSLQEFVYYDKYARWNDELGRRETWEETIRRVTEFLRDLSNQALDDRTYDVIYKTMLNGEVSPSMRLMRSAGLEAHRNHISLYNCAYIPIESVESIVELLWISMSGVGVGYSVEHKYINYFPVMPVKLVPYENSKLVIEDSAEGWVIAFKTALMSWFSGFDVEFDFSKIRPEGARLKTKGGTASGPQVLKDLFDFVRNIILNRAGKKLRPIDIFDICTKIGDCAVSGGVRRSAQLCMFDLDDEEMLNAKSGDFWVESPHRTNANISVVLEERLPKDQIRKIIEKMDANKTGEPGIVSRYAMNESKPFRRSHMKHGGTNACAEIILNGMSDSHEYGGQFCNLASANIHQTDNEYDIARKVVVATIIGTIQAMATNFRLLRPAWKEICESERLLGVSLVGIMENSTLVNEDNLRRWRQLAVDVNREYARMLGINAATAITCMKPAGNSSVLYNTARGINARYATYYIRRVRINRHTPIFALLRDAGIPLSPENGGDENSTTWVATFYAASPKNVPTMEDISAKQQLKNWGLLKRNWTEHNPSITVEYLPDEINDIIDFVYKNQSIANGIAFLPKSDHVYEQAPYEKISRAEYENALRNYPEVDFSLLPNYELSDMTEGAPLECSSGVCDLI